MLKQLIVSTLSLITVNAFAMQCPLPSDWIHEKGKPWKLSAKAEQEGWKAVPSTIGQDSDFTTIPAGSFLEARVFYYSNVPVQDGGSCSYYLPIVERDPLVATTKTTFDFKKYAKPSGFYLERVAYSYDTTGSVGTFRCNTHADQPFSCRWDS